MCSTKAKVTSYRPPMPKPVNKSNRRCAIFNCDHCRGNICCADCINKPKCKNPCLNNPQQCGRVKIEVVDG